MPAGEVRLLVVHKNRKPKKDDLFDSFRKQKPISIQAVVIGKSYRWRPQGLNTYNVQIFAIENRVNSEKKISRNSFVAKGILLGMNGEKGKFPEDFSWPADGLKHGSIEISFTGHSVKTLSYREYSTL